MVEIYQPANCTSLCRPSLAQNVARAVVELERTTGSPVKSAGRFNLINGPPILCDCASIYARSRGVSCVVVHTYVASLSALTTIVRAAMRTEAFDCTTL